MIGSHLVKESYHFLSLPQLLTLATNVMRCVLLTGAGLQPFGPDLLFVLMRLLSGNELS